jgi:ubiquinone/menaquinone biosynthesis C-methylase UbiE
MISFMVAPPASRRQPTTVNVAGNTYDKYASSNPIEQRMMRGFFGALDAALAGLDPRVVVEVGAGEGRITQRLHERFPSATVVGLDLPDVDLQDEWASATVPMFVGDATRLPFADHSVDLVVALEVLEHVERSTSSPESAATSRCCRCRGNRSGGSATSLAGGTWATSATRRAT